jgi:hypothetical protein
MPFVLKTITERAEHNQVNDGKRIRACMETRGIKRLKVSSFAGEFGNSSADPDSCIDSRNLSM